MKHLRFILAAGVLAAPALLRAVPGVPGEAPKTAFAVPVADNWKISGGLPDNALIISLQGLANTDAPRLYIDYPADWHFHDFSPVKQFYHTKYGVQFQQLATSDEVLTALGRYAKGYVVWDTKVRTSLNVAFTAAGILRGAVVDEALIPLAEKHGLKKLADFRGQFEGMSDLQIYRWAFARYWADCSHDRLIWMGGVAGDAMEPGVADLGIATHAFFADLSADPKKAPEEYAFHREILSKMEEGSFIFGWHSYAKDTEGQWVTLTSGYGLKVIGLNTFPNGTFLSQIGFSPGFKFSNSNHVTRHSTLTVQPKVYLCLVQSDSMGIGAWVEPERGQIPYGWDVGIDGMRWYAGVMEMFAQDRTPNDYFNGGQSGYMYPAATAENRWPGLMKEMNEGMARADEHVVSIMDHTLRGQLVGYFDVSKRVVDLYYKYAPDAIGFINGYAAAHTYDLRNGQAFMSYDYYLDEHRSPEDAAADLNELIRLNPVRPYYLLVHVRESNSIKRVMGIVAQLEDKPEVVPVDTFLKLAASKKTYETRYGGSP